MLAMLKRGIRGCWFYFWGHLFALFFYQKKYLTGRWFRGKLGGLCASGWVWVTHDAVARILLRQNTEARFPVSPNIRILCPENIRFNPDDLNNFQSSGIYFQAIGRITIGKGTYIAPNVGLITSNHVIGDLDAHEPPEPITLGEGCWLGMNSVVLPGVTLGDGVVVGAGAVVTKSFPEGHCVIAGNPARKIKDLSKERPYEKDQQ